MSNTLTLNNPLSESDWDKISDVELEKTKHIWFETPSGKRVDFVRGDVLDKIKGYIDHIKNTGMGKKKSLEFIEKFIEGLKTESEGKE